jgi:type I restriction enzyme, S subunit
MQLLEKHFDLAFAAPNGVQKLRELILTFAMQGKLVPQDPNDQPASEILKEIEAEKSQLVLQGKIKEPKSLPEIRPEEMRYHLPESWEWVRLGSITNVVRGGSPRPAGNPEYYDGNIPFLKVADLTATDEMYLQTYTYSIKEAGLHKTRMVPPDTLLLTNSGATLGIPKICTFETTFNDGIAAFIYMNENLYKPFLYYFLYSRTQWFLDVASRGQGQPNLNIDIISETPVPLPPLAEQKLIVAKIDRLMAQCDELENLGGDRNQKRITIHTAAINRLLAAQETSDFSTAWDFIQQHFSELYSVKENVAELRKAILQLAVMGKLVPQDPNDQPASELLKAIELEKQKLVEEGEINKLKPMPKINLNEVPYQLPKQWEWTRLGSVVISSHAGRSPQCLPRPRIDYEWGVLKVSAVSWGAFNPDENKALPPGMQPRPEDEVKVGDFLLSRANTEELVARSVVVTHTPPNLMISDKTVRLIVSSQVDKQFINVAHLSNYARTYYASNASGTSSSMKNVSREIMYQVPIPLPPLAEQFRIVAKIEQLMALCDRLEQQIDAATDKRTELLNALMAQV